MKTLFQYRSVYFVYEETKALVYFIISGSEQQEEKEKKNIKFIVQ